MGGTASFRIYPENSAGFLTRRSRGSGGHRCEAFQVRVVHVLIFEPAKPGPSRRSYRRGKALIIRKERRSCCPDLTGYDIRDDIAPVSRGPPPRAVLLASFHMSAAPVDTPLGTTPTPPPHHHGNLRPPHPGSRVPGSFDVQHPAFDGADQR